MIKIISLTKRYGDFTAIDNISFEIEKGAIYGLVGINGAGKSTLLRTVAGIYSATKGSVVYDGLDIFDNPRIKSRIAFVPDELYLPSTMNLAGMMKKYKTLYHGKFNAEKCKHLAGEFELDLKQRFNTFSKGMRRQAATVLALSLETEYIFFDETFDGLDPFKRAYIKRLIANDVRERGATAVISSHSLKELADVCDRLAVLDKGGLVFESDVSSLDAGVIKVQVAFAEDFGRDRFGGFDVIDYSKQGRVAQLIVRGDKEDVDRRMRALSPILYETLPLSLEEVFTLELGRRGVNTFAPTEGEVSRNA